MSAADQIRRLWDHLNWADEAILAALRGGSSVPADVLREYRHILGAEEVWLARIESRSPRTAIWPDITLDEAVALASANRAGYERLLSGITDEQLDEFSSYTNSAGKPFTTAVGDILLHVVLHGQYHRGKVNVLLRQAGLEPAPVDFIAFVRGAAAARTTK